MKWQRGSKSDACKATVREGGSLKPFLYWASAVRAFFFFFLLLYSPYMKSTRLTLMDPEILRFLNVDGATKSSCWDTHYEKLTEYVSLLAQLRPPPCSSSPRSWPSRRTHCVRGARVYRLYALWVGWLRSSICQRLAMQWSMGGSHTLSVCLLADWPAKLKLKIKKIIIIKYNIYI